MYLSKRTIRNLMVFFMAFIALEFVPVLVSVPSIVFHQLKNCVFCVLWLDTINKRIVQPRIRKMLMIMAFDKNARVVMVSALGKEELVKKSLLSGAKNYIVKPLDRKKVLERISASLK